jgi:hypothetical protein
MNLVLHDTLDVAAEWDPLFYRIGTMRMSRDKEQGNLLPLLTLPMDPSALF